MDPFLAFAFVFIVLVAPLSAAAGALAGWWQDH